MSNDPKGISAREQLDIDLAEDDLNFLDSIIKDAGHLMCRLAAYVDHRGDARISYRDIQYATGAMNDVLADLLAREYSRLTDKAGSLTRSQLPSLSGGK